MCLLGCGIATGYGAALNTAKVSITLVLLIMFLCLTKDWKAKINFKIFQFRGKKTKGPNQDSQNGSRSHMPQGRET
jgi:hypothetical protein